MLRASKIRLGFFIYWHTNVQALFNAETNFVEEL